MSIDESTVTETPSPFPVEEAPIPSVSNSSDNPLDVHVSINLPPGTRVRVTVEAFPDGKAPAIQQTFTFPVVSGSGQPASVPVTNRLAQLRAWFSRRKLT